MLICGASFCLLASDLAIILWFWCAWRCARSSLSRYSQWCVLRPSTRSNSELFVPWRLRSTEPCGDQWFLWWPDCHFHRCETRLFEDVPGFFMILHDFRLFSLLFGHRFSVGCWILVLRQVLLCMLTALGVMLLSEIKGLPLDRGDAAGMGQVSYVFAMFLVQHPEANYFI